MIDRQTIIDAIQDLQESVACGQDFVDALTEIAEEYSIPEKTIIANIERIEPLDIFIDRGKQAYSNQRQREQIFAPLKEYLINVFGRTKEPSTAPVATILFIQKTFDRELWPEANAYARRHTKTLRLTRNLDGKQNATNK